MRNLLQAYWRRMYSSGINRMQQLRRRKGNVCSGNICGSCETESEPAKEAAAFAVAETESADKAGLLLADVKG